MRDVTKHDTNKPRYDLIPPLSLKEIAKTFAIGANKYSDRNWEMGTDWSRYYRALLSHANAWWAGEKFDKEDGQHHLAAVAVCAMMLMEYERTCPEKDTRKEDKIGL